MLRSETIGMKVCKYYDKHLETIKEYISCLYNLEKCSSGGLLHILTDDDNYDDDSIFYCLRECLLHPEKEESVIGQIICEEYLKLPIQKRRLLHNDYIGNFMCHHNGNCEECIIEIGDEFENR